MMFKKYEVSETDKIEVERMVEFDRKAGKSTNPGIVYFIRAENGLFKVGRTKDLDARLKSIQNMSPEKLDVFHFFATSDCVFAEKCIHEMWNEYRLHGEWFDLPNDEIHFIRSAKVNSL